MEAAEVLKRASKFLNLETANNFANGCFKLHLVVMIDEPYYAVCTFREANILVEAGYELAPQA